MYSTGKWALLVMLFVSARVAAQTEPPSLGQLSPVERSREDFYGAIARSGSPVAITWKLSASTVTLGQPLTLTLTVTNMANPDEVRAPKLQDFPAFQAIFKNIENAVSSQSEPGTIDFTYRVVPLNAGKFQVPELRYLFYQPGLTPNRRFQRALPPESPKFEVLPAAVQVVPPVPLDEPEWLFELPEMAETQATTSPPAWTWFALILGAPVVLASWIFAWRWRYPDAARQAKIRQHRAVRVALDRLRKAASSADPARNVSTALLGYLHARYGLPPSAQTPGEVADELRSLGWQERLVQDAESLFRQCDASRFSITSEPRPELAAAAVRWVEVVEGVPA